MVSNCSLLFSKLNRKEYPPTIKDLIYFIAFDIGIVIKFLIGCHKCNIDWGTVLIFPKETFIKVLEVTFWQHRKKSLQGYVKTSETIIKESVVLLVGGKSDVGSGKN